MTSPANEIDLLLPTLSAHVAAIKAEAEAAGFKYCAIQISWNVCDDVNRPQTQVYLSRGGSGNSEQIECPSVAEAFNELVRRLDWQRDVNMKRIAATGQESNP